MIRFLILGFLRDGHAYHGYALMKLYRERSGLQVNTGNFYREIRRLEMLGFARSAANPDGADPRRSPFTITEAGRAAFDRWLWETETIRGNSHDDAISSHVLFFGPSEPIKVAELLECWKEELCSRQKEVERARDAATRKQAVDGDSQFTPLALLHARRLKHLTADMEFIEEFRAAFDLWSAKPSIRSTYAASQNQQRLAGMQLSRVEAGKSQRGAARRNGTSNGRTALARSGGLATH